MSGTPPPHCSTVGLWQDTSGSQAHPRSHRRACIWPGPRSHTVGARGGFENRWCLGGGPWGRGGVSGASLHQPWIDPGEYGTCGPVLHGGVAAGTPGTPVDTKGHAMKEAGWCVSVGYWQCGPSGEVISSSSSHCVFVSGSPARARARACVCVCVRAREGPHSAYQLCVLRRARNKCSVHLLQVVCQSVDRSTRQCSLPGYTLSLAAHTDVHSPPAYSQRVGAGTSTSPHCHAGSDVYLTSSASPDSQPSRAPSKRTWADWTSADGASKCMAPSLVLESPPFLRTSVSPSATSEISDELWTTEQEFLQVLAHWEAKYVW